MEEVDRVGDRHKRISRQECPGSINVPFHVLPKNLSDLADADVYLIACPFGVRDPSFPFFESVPQRSMLKKPPKFRSNIC